MKYSHIYVKHEIYISRIWKQNAQSTFAYTMTTHSKGTEQYSKCDEKCQEKQAETMRLVHGNVAEMRPTKVGWDIVV